jgi:hypothetical protein
LAAALADLATRLGAGRAVQRPSAAALPAMPPPRPWLNPWAWILSPVLGFALVAWWREGGWAMLALLPPLLLLYAGLYLILRYRPPLLTPLAWLAATPLVYLAMAVRHVAARWGAGFSLTGFGGLGLGRQRTP